MKIQRLKAQNFKSFDQLDLELGDFNVFIGANASGKSNVLNVLRFLRDIAASGLRNAVSLQGEVEFLRNVRKQEAVPTEVSVDFSATKSVSQRLDLDLHEESEMRYALALDYQGRQDDFALSKDSLKVKEKYFVSEGEYQKVKGGGLEIAHQGGRVEIVSMPEAGPDYAPPDYYLPSSLSSKEALLSKSQFKVFYQHSGERGFEDVVIYDFDTRLIRKAAPVTSKADLEEDGSNVALVLKNIVEDEEGRRRFTNLVQYVLPFVKGVEVERFAGRSLIATLEETHAPGTHLPASLLSEGTIKVIALLIALYFEDKPVIAFEEPASSLHPRLVSRVVEMMKEQAGAKQIFVTTHSPEVIKYAGLENVYLVSRDENGFSQVTKPAEKEEVRIFLENEMGIEDLFVQDLLGI